LGPVYFDGLVVHVHGDSRGVPEVGDADPSLETGLSSFAISASRTRMFRSRRCYFSVKSIALAEHPSDHCSRCEDRVPD